MSFKYFPKNDFDLKVKRGGHHENNQWLGLTSTEKTNKFFYEKQTFTALNHFMGDKVMDSNWQNTIFTY